MRCSILPIIALAISALGVSAQTVLKTVDRGGKKYYRYKVEADESLYGIAMKMGWDQSVLEAENPNAVTDLKKGYLLYYPADSPTSRTDKVSFEVTYNASAYDVAKYLGVTTEQLYAQNPSARHGIKIGDVISLDYSKLNVDSANKEYIEASVAQKFAGNGATADNKPDEGKMAKNRESRSNIVGGVQTESAPFTGVSTRNPLIGLDKDLIMDYTIQPSDNLRSVAVNFNTTVRDIFFLNPAISPNWFPEGLNIRLLPGSKDADRRTEAIQRRYKTSLLKYKVKKGDTWQSLADEYSISVAELKGENPELTELKKGKKISIPQFSESTDWIESVFTDVREESQQGQQEIWAEVRDYGKPTDDSENKADIVILTSTTSQDAVRDREFLRGFLLGVKELDLSRIPIGIQVVNATDGYIPAEAEIKATKPDLIVATCEKDFPESIISFGADKGSNVVNVFDAKSEQTADAPYLFQVLMPSQDMNSAIAADLADRFSGREFIFTNVDDKDSDSYTTKLKENLKAAKIKFRTISTESALQNLDLFNSKGVVIVSGASTATAIRNILQATSALRESFPNLQISLVGRPTWIVHIGKMENEMKTADTFIPSRFSYNPNSAQWTRFVNAYKDSYTAGPTASFPPYAAMGYDVARYFITSLLKNGGDFNLEVNTPEGIDIDFDFQRSTSVSGYINRTLYYMHYSNSGIKSISFGR